MEKVITIEEGRSYNFKASAFSPIAYNKLFPGRDFLRDMDALRDAKDEMDGSGDYLTMDTYEMFVRVAYTLAWQGFSKDPRPTQEQKDFRDTYPDPWDWIDSFNMFSIYEILPEILELWYIGSATNATSKKNRRKPSAK